MLGLKSNNVSKRGPCTKNTYIIEARTKWLSFWRQHFQVHFPLWKILIQISLKSVLVSNWQWVSNDVGNGSALNRWQTIIWINDDPFCWCIYALSGLDKMEFPQPCRWCCHYFPPCSLHTLGASETLSYNSVSFELILNGLYINSLRPNDAYMRQ